MVNPKNGKLCNFNYVCIVFTPTRRSVKQCPAEHGAPPCFTISRFGKKEVNSAGLFHRALRWFRSHGLSKTTASPHRQVAKLSLGRLPNRCSARRKLAKCDRSRATTPSIPTSPHIMLTPLPREAISV